MVVARVPTWDETKSSVALGLSKVLTRWSLKSVNDWRACKLRASSGIGSNSLSRDKTASWMTISTATARGDQYSPLVRSWVQSLEASFRVNFREGTDFGRGKSASRWGCSRYNEITGTYLSDKLPDHAVPAARNVRVFRAVFSVLHDPQLVWKFVRKYFTRRAKHHFFRRTFSIIDSASGRGFVTSFRYLSRWGWLRQILLIIKVILLLELWILVGVKWESLALIIKNYLKTGAQYSNKE